MSERTGKATCTAECVVSCGCCTAGHVCMNHMDIPRGVKPNPCPRAIEGTTLRPDAQAVAECYGTEDDYCPFDQTPGAPVPKLYSQAQVERHRAAGHEVRLIRKYLSSLQAQDTHDCPIHGDGDGRDCPKC